MSEILVAAGTLVLALATFALVWVTYKLAVSSEASLRAQVRPILIPAQVGLIDYSVQESVSGSHSEYGIVIPVTNAGPGPALYIRAEMDPRGWATAKQGPVVALAAGEQVLLAFQGKPPQEMVQLLVDYRDLGGRTYSTAITIDIVGNRAYDAQLLIGPSTHQGDAVYPQAGLRDASKRATK